MRIKKVVVGALQTNCYLVFNEGEMLVVDPGAEGGKILKEIERSSCRVKYLVNTHSHYDHIGANKDVLNKTNARFLDNLKDDDEISIGGISLRIIEAPGHKDDCICLMASDFIIVGDVLFEDGRGRTDLPGSCFEDMKKTVQKLKELIPPEMIVYSGHGSSFIAKDHYLLSGIKELSQ